jgi:hypothetical protein
LLQEIEVRDVARENVTAAVSARTKEDGRMVQKPARGSVSGAGSRWARMLASAVAARGANGRLRCRPRPPAVAAEPPRRVQDSPGNIHHNRCCCKSLKTRRRGFDDSSSPSASLPIRDILIWSPEPAGMAQNLGVRAHTSEPPGHANGPFRAVSRLSRATFSTQPNHGRFGTDVES